MDLIYLTDEDRFLANRDRLEQTKVLFSMLAGAVPKPQSDHPGPLEETLRMGSPDIKHDEHGQEFFYTNSGNANDIVCFHHNEEGTNSFLNTNSGNAKDVFYVLAKDSPVFLTKDILSKHTERQSRQLSGNCRMQLMKVFQAFFVVLVTFAFLKFKVEQSHDPGQKLFELILDMDSQGVVAVFGLVAYFIGIVYDCCVCIRLKLLNTRLLNAIYLRNNERISSGKMYRAVLGRCLRLGVGFGLQLEPELGSSSVEETGLLQHESVGEAVENLVTFNGSLRSVYRQVIEICWQVELTNLRKIYQLYQDIETAVDSSMSGSNNLPVVANMVAADFEFGGFIGAATQESNGDLIGARSMRLDYEQFLSRCF